jgi:hypothetical protein
MQAQLSFDENPFESSQEKFLGLIHRLQAPKTKAMALGELESFVEVEGREVLRTMLEEHIRLRGTGDIGPLVRGKDDIARTHRRERVITMKTIFGEITIDRTVYGARGHESLVPKDAVLNLPRNLYSHRLEQRLAYEIARGSFEEAMESVKAQTGVEIPKRQAEEIARRAALDFEPFYEERSTSALRRAARQNELLVLTTDGKGVVMRKEDLREATKKRAEKEKKLRTRLSKGEKKNAKRMAQVASVYSIERHERTAEEIVNGEKSETPPKPEAKRVWASLEQDQDDIIGAMFDEARLRDPRSKRDWVVLIDGQPAQLGLIEAELKRRDLTATIVLDVIHVIEYLWKASRDFYPESSPEGEEWVSRYLLMVLEGKAKLVAAAMRRSATRQEKGAREGIETCAGYLHNNAEYLRYDEYLAAGLPIGTGVIEGACRHLVKDRMDITGARWSLGGAEAVLRLRSLHASGDYTEYWAYHEAAEYERNHRTRYANPQCLAKPALRIVK